MPDLISLNQWKAIFPRAPIEFLDAFNNRFLDFGIDTINKAAGFLSQCAVESGCFTVFTENLNYGAEGLLGTFGKYFDSDSASVYARKPQMIANRVYGSRMGNGPEDSGEGWLYRGRGIIQLTGKRNYQEYAKYKKCKVEDIPQYLETFDGIVDSALWFWKSNNCNRWAGDIVKLSKLVNIGNPNSDKEPHGLRDRMDIYEVAKAVLRGDNYTGKGFGGPISSSGKRLLSGAKDSKGNYVSTNVSSTSARDSNIYAGSSTKSTKRIKLTKNFHRDDFACPNGCGANTVDTLLILVMQKLANQLEGRPIKINIGTVCDSYKGLSCDQKVQHVLGKAADFEVPPWPDKNYPQLPAKDVVKLLENMFGDMVYCYAINDNIVHVDVGNT